MTACRNCAHYSYAHEDPRLGELCLVEVDEYGGLCECPGYEPDWRHS